MGIPSNRSVGAIAIAALVLSGIALLIAEVQLLDIQFAHRFLRHQDYVDCSDAQSRDRCVVPLLKLGDFNGDKTQLCPDPIFEVDWSQHTTLADVVHLEKIQRACTTHKDSVISWRFGLVGGEGVSLALLNRSDDQGVVEELKKCPSFDVYIPPDLRGQGYCEDAAAYVKYGHARMLPRWVLETEFFNKTANRSFSYHELCPRTPMLMLNHYWDAHRESPKWPATKPLYLMPNIEMFELQAEHYWQADVVLCKTIVCADYLTKWYAQQGNTRFTRVIYMRHTSSDIATGGLLASGEKITQSEWTDLHVNRKHFEHPTFIHTAGTSLQKGSSEVLNCWLSRPDLPVLDLYMAEDLYKRVYSRFDERIESEANKNVRLHLGKLDAAEFGLTIANASVFVCPSVMEGYGHYINQARAAGGLVLTPDVPPMNELVTTSSGLLINSARVTWTNHFLGGASNHEFGLRNVTGFVAQLGSADVCEAVDKVLKNLNARQRQQMGKKARQQYLYDTAFFAWKMDELRVALRPVEKNILQR